MLRNLYLINRVLREEVIEYYSKGNKKSFGVGRADEKQNQTKEQGKLREKKKQINEKRKKKQQKDI